TFHINKASARQFAILCISRNKAFKTVSVVGLYKTKEGQAHHVLNIVSMEKVKRFIVEVKYLTILNYHNRYRSIGDKFAEAFFLALLVYNRSEERRVGKEGIRK